MINLSFLYKNRNYRALLIFLVFYVAFGAFLTLNQASIIYQPGRHQVDFSNCPALPEAERIRWNSNRFYSSNLGRDSLVVIYHGNAGRACDRAFLAHFFSELGLDYLIVEYTGYALDGATPSHETLRSDVKTTIAYLSTLPHERVIVFGESLGVSAAALHASLKPPAGLILVSAYPDFPSVARQSFWFYPTSLLVENPFPVIDLLSNYEAPTLFLHAENDTMIPLKLGRRVADSLEQAQFVSIPGTDHNNLFSSTKTYETIASFLVTPPDQRE